MSRCKNEYKNVLFVLFIVLLVLTAGCQRVPEPDPESLAEQASLHSPVAGAFYVNGRGAGASYDSFYINRELIHEVSPLWYYVREDGSLKEEVDGEALKLARDSGVKVIPLVAFLSNASSFVLKGDEARKAAIAGIARVVREHGYDGINIDFEIVKAAGRDYQAEREGLSLFVEGLRRELDPSGKRLDICVLPPEQPPVHLAQIYDPAVLSELADRLVVMTYDHSHSGTEPGPVAPLPWVEANIKALLQLGIPPEKISLGIASYGYDWPTGGTRADVVSAREVMQSIGQGIFSAEWDSSSQTPFVMYRDSRSRDREIWFENSAASEQKMELIKKYRLAGFYLWRLGYEDELFWQTVKEALLQ
ncbi:MAG TPA: glycosyl hydrolase family 18 protein [Bacillota bacterium]|nr:glycosyl hydrolase family 18 protein [Bacillota bacterium]HQD76103.1 glycosyl hydrolase family 18 protein [Bacillota bacterium]HUM59225.1 glycosyl hydrolase family 18 protein [Bacillota bacterium]